MSEILRRAYTPYMDLEIRGDGRTVYGMAVPFDQPTTIRERGHVFDEVFRMGSFAETIRERGSRVKFLLNHDRQSSSALLGKAVMLREDPSGLVGEFHVAATDDGDRALELVRAGVLDSLSIGFVPSAGGTRGEPGRDPLVERLAVKLMEVSAVAFPAYDGALISGVRAEDSEALVPDQDEAAPDQGDAPDQRYRGRVLARLDLDIEGVIR